LPAPILNRKDKMGFPVPLNEWISGELKEFVYDILHTAASRQDNFIDYKAFIKNIDNTGQFSRKVWGFLCYEMWQQVFHDKASEYRTLLKRNNEVLI
jgi:asparagine synthase (glutamine-hydrolysing)